MKRRTGWILAGAVAIVAGGGLLASHQQPRTKFSAQIPMLARLQPVRTTERYLFASSNPANGVRLLAEDYDVPADSETVLKALYGGKRLAFQMVNWKEAGGSYTIFVNGPDDEIVSIRLKRTSPKQTHLTVTGERQPNAFDRFFSWLRGLSRR